MQRARCVVAVVGVVAAGLAVPPQGGGARPAQPQCPRGVQVMALSGPWPDGGPIPARFTQAGGEHSPALRWSGAPEGTASFVLMVHDLDAVSADGLEATLHWLVWNIPASASGLPEGVEQGVVRPDGSRQISVTGPSYRGPGAPASGPAHHYVFELYALDTMLPVPAAGLSPVEARAAVRGAMAGHVRGKAVYTGLYRRGP